MTWPALPATVPIAGPVATLADYAAKKFQGLHGWATDAPSGSGSAASLIYYYNSTQYAVMARRDAAQTFAAGQVFADLATIYKAQSATSTVIPFNLDGNNSAGARVTYATLAATIREPAVGALSSRWALQAQRANTLTSVVRGGDLADLCGAGAEGLQVVYGALYMGNTALSDASRNVTAATLQATSNSLAIISRRSNSGTGSIMSGLSAEALSSDGATYHTIGRSAFVQAINTLGANYSRYRVDVAINGVMTQVLEAGSQGLSVMQGPLKVDTIQGYTTTDEVAIGNTAAVLLLNASNGTSGARFRVAHAQTGSVLYRWQDSAGVTQMTLSPSGGLTIPGGLTVGSIEAISSTRYATLTGATLTGKASFAASSAGAATFTIPAGTAPTSPVDGDVWRDSTGINARIFGSLATRHSLVHVPFTGRRDVAVGTAQSDILPPLSLPANFWIPGRTLHINFAIQADTTNGRWLTFKLGSRLLVAIARDESTWAGVVDLYLTCLSGGASARFSWAARVTEQSGLPVIASGVGCSLSDDANWTEDATATSTVSLVQIAGTGGRQHNIYHCTVEII